MRTIRRIAWVFAACCVLTAGTPARAELKPHWSRRELTVRSEVIVIVKALEPLHPWSKGNSMRAIGPEKPVKFEVLEVIRGEGVKVADKILVNGLSRYILAEARWRVPKGKKAKLPEIVKGLLFLWPDKKTEKADTYQLVVTGIRYLTKQKEVLYPLQMSNPGPYSLTLAEGTNWDKMLEKIRSDLSVLDEVTVLKEIEDPVQRNKALFDWIETHKKEFCEHANIRTRNEGWCSLEEWIFEWITASCIPEDCWRAVKLYLEIKPKCWRGSPVEIPCFASREGRKLLVEVAVDENQFETDRVRALRWLIRGTFNPYSRGKLPECLVRVDRKEQKKILKKLIPLLESEKQQIRESVVQSIRDLSNPTQGSVAELETNYALRALVNAYEVERPGKMRDKLAEAVREVGGERHWEELTGNPFGLVALLEDLQVTEKKVIFTLHVSWCAVEIRECPTMTIENIGKSGEIIQKKSLPLPVTYPKKKWKEMSRRGFYQVEIPLDKLAAGKWRVSVSGTCRAIESGEEGKWSSEPKIFTVPEPQPARGKTPEQSQPGKQ